MTVPPTSPRRRFGLLLATVLVGAPVLGACADDGGTASDGGASSATPTAAATSDDPGASPSGVPTQSASTQAGGSGVAAPVYFTGDTPQGPRLFREFHELSGSGNPVDEALALAAAGDAFDPDYGTLLPAGTPTATTGDGLIQISLPDASWVERPAGMRARQAELAVQQLVYTAQGVLQDRVPVVFLLDGSLSPVLGLEAPEGFEAAPDLDVLALVNLTTPEEGASVSGSISVEGVASSFEATVPWELRDADGVVVATGFATAEGWMDKLYPFATDVPLADVAPGDYTFVALTDDPSDGEGSGPTEDTKAITVS
ncbi:MAG: Gmad2 immunoglobulin-like domain-containing protein [Nocardioides sp.]|nr:Gmad2 immunoglobulin-like domain-containing protein [Nocardioides sp.]